MYTKLGRTGSKSETQLNWIPTETHWRELPTVIKRFIAQSADIHCSTHVCMSEWPIHSSQPQWNWNLSCFAASGSQSAHSTWNHLSQSSQAIWKKNSGKLTLTQLQKSTLCNVYRLTHSTLADWGFRHFFCAAQGTSGLWSDVNAGSSESTSLSSSSDEFFCFRFRCLVGFVAEVFRDLLAKEANIFDVGIN